MAYPDRPGWKARDASLEAAYAVARHATTLRERVHSFLQDRYPAVFSADQIADSLGETILSVRPRVSELKKMGAIEAVSQRHQNRSGMSAHCWRAVVRTGGEA
jgi:predicted ArsR family transcriptional regulator